MKKVSVLTITYNHEKYIRETLNSALMQIPALHKCGYSLEIIVADDCSTDSNGAIISELAAQHKEIVPVFNEANKGIMNNFADAYAMCTGEYTAFLEGDDAWTHPEKLALQVSFLEQNPEFVISSHNVLVAYEDAPEQNTEWLGKEHRGISTVEDLLRFGSGGATCSLVFKKSALPLIPDWVRAMQGGDWIVQCLITSGGKMKYFPEVMGMYRRHSGGISAAGNDKDKEINIFLAGGIEHCSALNRHYNYRYDDALQDNLIRYFYPNLIAVLLKYGEYEPAAVYTFKMLFARLISGDTEIDNYIKALVAIGYEQTKEALVPVLEELSALAMQVKPLRKSFVADCTSFKTPRTLLYIGRAYNEDVETLRELYPAASIFCYDQRMKEDTFLYPLYSRLLTTLSGITLVTTEQELLERLEGNAIDMVFVNDENSLEFVAALIMGFKGTETPGFIFPLSYGAVIYSAIMLEFPQLGTAVHLPELLRFRYGAHEKLTVIMPCYNCAETVEESIRSVTAQNLYAEYEVVCTNDCSTDNTNLLLLHLEKEIPELKVVQHTVNKGGAAARNTSVKFGTGTLLFCLDSDNVLAPGSLNSLLCFRENIQSEAAAFEELRFFKEHTGNVTHSWFFASETGICGLQHIVTEIQTPAASGNYLFTRSSWERAGGYPEGRGAMDAWGFGFRQHATGTGIALLPGTFYFHRLSENSYWTRDEKEGKNNRNAAAIMREYIHLFDDRSAAWLCTEEPNTLMFQAIEKKVLGLKENEEIVSPVEASQTNEPAAQDTVVPDELTTDEGNINAPLKLHLGCGERYMEGYINIDYPPANHSVQTNTKVDLYAEITHLSFAPESVDEIRLHHVFEHFDRATALALLIRWHGWLKPGGILMIETPDLEESINLFVNPAYSYTQKQSVLRHIFGSHEAFWAVHWDGWYKEKYIKTLGTLGYGNLGFKQEEWQMTRNITVVATKQQSVSYARQLEGCKELLADSLVDRSPSELSMLEVWYNEALAVLQKSEYLHRDPALSIFMPVYNGEKYIAETVNSLLAQSFDDFELLIGDDGSKDGTVKIVKLLAAKDKRIRLFTLPHNNEVVTRNFLVRVAHPRSKYLLNHDSDDISLPDKLKKLVGYLEANPNVAICGTLAEYFTETKEQAGVPPLATEPGKIRATFAECNHIVNSAGMIRRSVFSAIGGYRELLRSVDDYDFYARALCSGFELANLNEILHRIRLHDKSIGATQSERQRKGEEVIRAYLHKYLSGTGGIVTVPPPAQSSRARDKFSLLFTVEFYYPRMGGAERVVQQIAEYMAERGHRVVVATSSLPERNSFKHNGVEIRQFAISGSIGNGIHGSDIERYQAMLRSDEFDICFHYAAQQWATDLVFETLPQTEGKRINIIAPCGYSALRNASTLRWAQFADYFNKIIPYFIPRFDAAVYHSAAYQDYEYAEQHKFANSVVIPNFIEVSEFGETVKGGFRHKYGITTEYMLLCVANYVEGKGQEKLIEAFKQMRRNDTTLVLIGKEGTTYVSLQAQAGENVYLLRDIPREDTVAALHDADVFVFASEIEAFPLVILEAMASGTPWVALPAGNIRELAGGIVTEEKDFAATINKLLVADSERAQLGALGRETVKVKYDKTSVLQRYEKLFLQLRALKHSTPLQQHTEAAGEVKQIIPAAETVQKKIEQNYSEIRNYLEAASICAAGNDIPGALRYLEDALELQPGNSKIEEMIQRLERELENTVQEN